MLFFFGAPIYAHRSTVSPRGSTSSLLKKKKKKKETELIQTFPGNCSAWVLLNAIQPSDGTVNWWSLFFRSGALVALLLQVVLAHWFISWFSVLRPLTMHRGRVMVP